jgi:hypothetical protein
VDHDLLGVVTVASGSVPAGAIVEAQLWVRRSDWHAVKEIFQVTNSSQLHEYRIVEVVYHVEPLTDRNGRVFDPKPRAVIKIADPPRILASSESAQPQKSRR